MVEEAKSRAWSAVNSELVSLYWNVGKWLSEKCARADWGDRTIRNIAERIARARPDLSGFSRPGLYRMRQFYELYKDDPIVSPLVRQIAWSNHLVVMARASTPEERRFYLEKCRANKDDAVVEYALSRSLSPTMVSTYRIALPDKKLLAERLHRITEWLAEASSRDSNQTSP